MRWKCDLMASIRAKTMLWMSFIDYFGSVTDPRADINVKHELLDVIFLTITGVVSGCEAGKIFTILVV